MLGFILLYWIGKYFYKLAEKYQKSEWGYALLGIGSYYGGILLAGFFTGIFVELLYPGVIENSNETLLGILMLPFGLLSCYVVYTYLEKTWKKNKPKNEMDAIGVSQEGIE